VAEALGDGLAEPVGLTEGLAVELDEPDDEGLGEADGRTDALGDAEELADGEVLVEGVIGEVVALLEGSVVAADGDEDVPTSLGAADAISPERPLSAASNALLAMALGSDDAESLVDALADGTEDADAVGDAFADVDSLADADADRDADALDDALGEMVGDTEPEALAVIDRDGDALAEGIAPSIGRTMHAWRGELTASGVFEVVSAAIAAEPVPNVAKIRLAETVIATPPVSRTPRVRAWLRNADRRERADT
jgi:hypothetical protein